LRLGVFARELFLDNGMSEQNELPQLPKGWVWTRLEDVADVIRGISFPKEARTNTPQDEYVACLRTANVQKEVEWDDLWFVPRKFVKREEQLVQLHDILISTANSLELVGKVAEVKSIPFAASIGAFISTIRVSQELEPRFIYFHLTSAEIQSALRETASTTTNISNISTTSVLNTDLKIPPLPEQQRIVAKIEELFSDLDAGVAALQKTKTELKRYRQVVLKAAVEGKLTAEWRAANTGKVESAEKLLERIRVGSRQDAKAQSKKALPTVDASELPALPEGWCWTRLDEITHNFDGRRIPIKDDKRSKGNYPYYGAQGIIDYVADYIFEGAFLLVAEDGANLISRVKPIAFQARGKFWVNNHAHIMQSLGEIPLSYLEYALNALDLRMSITGTAQPKLTQAAMNKLPVPIPPLAEQQQIVAEVERRLSVAEQVEKTVDAALKQAERLRQSILRQAFAGKLVPQDPGDEPAERLLERIGAERAKQASKLKTPKFQW
jgi:type I restriction enzyme S subunit